ncbi:MAG: cupredoxin domain-containing protein [Pseudonocardiaceae bacterium]
MTPTSRTRPHRVRGVLAALAVAVPAVATLTLAPAAASGQTHEAQSVTVPIRSFVFTPSELTVNTGDTVTWVNEDQAPHDVTSQSAPASFASGTLMNGQSYSYTFAAPGSYSYLCSIHPDMVATVTAMDHSPAPAQAAPPEEAAPAESAPAEEVPAESVPAESAPVEGAPAEGVPAEGTAATAPTAGAVPAPSGVSVPTVAQPAPATTQAVGVAQSRQLDPLLIIAGIALGVATLCLLLVTSRSTDRG